MKKLFEESLAGKYCKEVSALSNGTMLLGDSDAHFVVEAIVTGMAEYAKTVASTTESIAVVIDDYSGNVLLALKVDHTEGEDENGSWVPTWTMDESEIEGCKKYPLSESKCNQIFIDTAYKLYRMEFGKPSSIYLAALAFGKVLRNYLDANAGADVFEVELPEFFTASVEVIDGEQAMAFNASTSLNKIVKNDEEA